MAVGISVLPVLCPVIVFFQETELGIEMPLTDLDPHYLQNGYWPSRKYSTHRVRVRVRIGLVLRMARPRVRVRARVRVGLG